MTNAYHIADLAQQSPPQVTPPTLLIATELEALAFLLPLSDDYPGFERWFRTRVIPGLRGGTRRIIRVERRDTLVGVGIGKCDQTERKICTVRIAEPYFGRGLGIKLFDSLLRWLETDKPHLTVSEKKLSAFERLFEYYGFNLTSAQIGRYVPRVTEFAYNEAIGKLGKLGDRVV